MKVIFFGLGSIGKRHLNNLEILSSERKIDLEVHAFRTNKKSTNEVLGVKNIYELTALDNDYDIAFITNPTSLHFKTLQIMKGKTSWFFVEKPIFEKKYDVDYVEGNRCYVAAPLRYKKAMQAAKKIVSSTSVLHVRIICSSYLPDWRKEDYRQSYSAKEELGGGIELDCIHELDYATYLFGLPEKSVSMIGKVSNLEINSHDSANYLLKYPNMFAEIHVDYFGKQLQRKLEIITDEETYEFDFYKNQIRMLSTNYIEEFKEETNYMYLSEMAYFLDEVITGNENHNNFKHALSVLEMAKGE